jgi:hypothetical protein
MRIVKSAVSILAGLVLLTVLAPPAHAAAPGIPITCGMVVRQDAVLYLARDLYCPDFGVSIQQDHSGDVPPPHVRIDLRGHTLSGPGTGNGITAYTGGTDATFVQVVNGRLKNWGVAVGGDYDFRTRNVALVGNEYGFFCSGACVADRTYFKDNDRGFHSGGEASGTVIRSTFVRNRVGASVLFIWGLSVDRSRFIKNDVGVLADDAQVTVSRSLFLRNRTAVKVLTHGNDGPCADLTRNVFVRNGVRLDGPLCAA